jgi:hypothetical protein
VRFYWLAEPRIVPVWHGGRLKLVPWGNRRGESRALPVTGWASQQKVEGGGWAEWRPEPVLVPATAAFEGGVWYQVRQGVCGLLATTSRGRRGCSCCASRPRIITG